MQIGLYFGSFNPIHIGHLIIANHVLQASELKQIWFVVSPQNPLKETSSLLQENNRLHLVQLAIEDNTKFKASNIEFNLPRPSYTIDTLTYLSEKYPQHEFTIIMGGDSIMNIKKWKNYEVLLAKYKLIIYQRPGYDSKVIEQENITYMQAPFLDISSTFIRERIKNKQSIKYLVMPAVEEYILANKYYK
jgi:nicotinate-nucleotide adenylyltransferase